MECNMHIYADIPDDVDDEKIEEYKELWTQFNIAIGAVVDDKKFAPIVPRVY